MELSGGAMLVGRAPREDGSGDLDDQAGLSNVTDSSLQRKVTTIKQAVSVAGSKLIRDIAGHLDTYRESGTGSHQLMLKRQT